MLSYSYSGRVVHMRCLSSTIWYWLKGSDASGWKAVVGLVKSNGHLPPDLAMQPHCVEPVIGSDPGAHIKYWTAFTLVTKVCKSQSHEGVLSLSMLSFDRYS